jgi:hypothetical protein
VPAQCTKITPTGSGRFDADGDGRFDYYKMLDPEYNEYYAYWLSRKSPYEAYDTLLARGASGWSDATRTGSRQSSMAGSTCLMADAELISKGSIGDKPAQSAEEDTITYELDFGKRMAEPMPYAWNKAGDQYALV